MMPNRHIALAGAIALITPLLLAPAYAADVATSDAPVLTRTTKAAAKDSAADVWSHTDETGYQFYGALPRVDVRRATAEHTSRKAVFTMSFADLVKGGHQTFVVQIRTKKMVRFVGVYAYPGNDKGMVFLRKRDDSDLVPKGIEHRIDYAKDKVRVVVPRKRLGTPAWFRVAMFNMAWADGSSVSYQDNPHHDRQLGQQEWLDGPPLSMKIYPG